MVALVYRPTRGRNCAFECRKQSDAEAELDARAASAKDQGTLFYQQSVLFAADTVAVERFDTIMLPNCLVIGAPRSGTTSLYEYLHAHPEIYMSPVKEPDFFARHSLDIAHLPAPGSSSTPDEEVRRMADLQADMDQYTALFNGAGNIKRRGEASAIYLGHPTAAAHIRRYIPDVKMIAVLRDPSERIHSHYVHASRVHSDFGSTKADEKEGLAEFTTVVDRAYRDGYSDPALTDPEVWVRSGFYFRHLSRFYSLFPKEQLRVFLFEDLVRDPKNLMAEIYRFLDVADDFALPTTEAFNASVVPRNRGLFRFFTTRNPVMQFARSLAPPKLRAAAMRTRNRVLSDSKPTLSPDMRRKLVSIYRDDIQQLQEMLGRDLSAWLTESGGK